MVILDKVLVWKNSPRIVQEFRIEGHELRVKSLHPPISQPLNFYSENGLALQKIFKVIRCFWFLRPMSTDLRPMRS